MRHPKIGEEILKAADGTQLTDEKRQKRTDRCDERKPSPIARSLHFMRPQTLGPKLCQFAALGASVGLIALIMPGAQEPANADGVVVQSSAPNYVRGDIVKDGQSISLGPEQSITVLDPTGELVTVSETSVFGAAETGETMTMNAWDALTWDKRRTAVGGTRTQSYEDCVALAETRRDLTAEECARIHLEENDEADTFELKLLGNPAAMKAGQPMKLSLKASYEADVSCRLQDASGQQTELPLSRNDSSLARLMSGTLTHLPKRGGAPFPAPNIAGEYTLACTAISSQAMQIAKDADASISNENEIQKLAISFSEISNAPLGFAEIKLTVVD